VLIDRSDRASGDFDFEFNYDQIEWEIGEASDGTDGLGGSSARAGYSDGESNPFEISGSAVNGAFLDSNSSLNGTAPSGFIGLTYDRLNSNTDGRFRFNVENGTSTSPNLIPTPSAVAGGLTLISLVGGLGAARRRRMANQSSL